jgi:hypothetical protein
MDIDPDVQMEDAVSSSSTGQNVAASSMDESPDSPSYDNGYATGSTPAVSSLLRSGPSELPANSLKQLDAWITTLEGCQPLAEEDVETLCNMVCGNHA